MPRRIRALLSAATTCFVAAVWAPAYAQGRIIPRPCPLPRDGMRAPICRPVPMSAVQRTRSDVRVTLAGRVLEYEVDERFVNRGGRIGEADYVFPLPAGAAFQDLKLSIDGDLVSGETMDAAQARGIYEEIVRRQRDPALVEWMGTGMLRARIFPILPGEEKRVVVRFQAVAQREGDALRVDYSRKGDATRPGGGGGASTFTLEYPDGGGYGTAYSPTHELDITHRDGLRHVSVRDDAGDLTLLVPLARSNAASIGVLTHAPAGDSGFALLTITPPVSARRELSPRDITLVLDVSGSMQGRKMEQARAAGRQLLQTLRPQDRLRIIAFSTDVRSFRDDAVYATRDNLRDATRYLDELDADGSTNIEGALHEVVRVAPTRGRLPLVLFITDGEPTVGERDPDRLVDIVRADHRHDVDAPRLRVFTFGLGADVNTTLLEQLAIEGGGTAEFVRPSESVERTVGLVAARLVDPVITDVRVSVDGDVHFRGTLPNTPSDIFAGRDLVVLTRYTGHGAANVTVAGRQDGRPVHWSSRVEFPSEDRGNRFVPRLWATQRIGYLSAEKRREGGSPEIDDEIRQLGERYGIPTEFTSYLVQEPRIALGDRMLRGRGAPGAPPAAVYPTGTIGGAATAAAPAPAAAMFEAARAAAKQRSTTSLATLDASMASDAAGVRRVGTRVFRSVGGVWTDAGYREGMRSLSVKPYSQAYFDLLARLPDLRDAFALGDRVVVAGRDVAVELTDSGRATLSSAEIDALARQW